MLGKVKYVLPKILYYGHSKKGELLSIKNVLQQPFKRSAKSLQENGPCESFTPTEVGLYTNNGSCPFISGSEFYIDVQV